MPGRSERGARDHEFGRRLHLRDREEFVSTHARHEGARAEAAHEVSRDRAYRCVAGGVALAVVDRLEVVDVTREDDDVKVLREPARQVLEEGAAVRKAGKDVLIREAVKRACVERDECPNTDVAGASEDYAEQQSARAERASPTTRMLETTAAIAPTVTAAHGPELIADRMTGTR